MSPPAILIANAYCSSSPELAIDEAEIDDAALSLERKTGGVRRSLRAENLNLTGTSLVYVVAHGTREKLDSLTPEQLGELLFDANLGVCCNPRLELISCNTGRPGNTRSFAQLLANALYVRGARSVTVVAPVGAITYSGDDVFVLKAETTQRDSHRKNLEKRLKNQLQGYISELDTSSEESWALFRYRAAILWKAKKDWLTKFEYIVGGEKAANKIPFKDWFKSGMAGRTDEKDAYRVYGSWEFHQAPLDEPVEKRSNTAPMTLTQIQRMRSMLDEED